jgi:alpha-glucosidase (family GH31 glycosyl hydrolase)
VSASPPRRRGAGALVLAEMMVPTGLLLALALSGGTHGRSQALLRSPGGATVKIEPWGANSLRVRVALAGHTITEDGVGALIPPGSDNKGAAVVPASPVAVDDAAGRITNGNIAATVGVDGLISVSRVSDNAVILRELKRTTVLNQSLDGNPRYNQTTVIFAAQKTDKVFGMGEHQHGQLDNKNVEQVAYRHPPKGPVMLKVWFPKLTVARSSSFLRSNHIPCYWKDWHNVSYDFEQCTVYRGGASQNGLGGNGGGSVCIPWIIIATNETNATTKKGGGGFGLSYGFLWNMPNYGTVSFWDENTTWMAEAATQIDYFITVPPADSAPSDAGAAMMNAYVDAVGHAPVMPVWAQGYWHSRNRYSSQSMLLDAAKGFHDRGVNVSVIVIDYMCVSIFVSLSVFSLCVSLSVSPARDRHWIHMGDFAFDPKSWPDIPGMMKTLESYGMRVRALASHAAR